MLLRVVHRGVRREVVHRGVGDGGARVVEPGVESVAGGDRAVTVAGDDGRGVVRRWVGESVAGCVLVPRDGGCPVTVAGDDGRRVVRRWVGVCSDVEDDTACVVADVDRGVIRRWVEVRLDEGVERGVMVQRGVESRLDVGSAVGGGVGAGFGRTPSIP